MNHHLTTSKSYSNIRDLRAVQPFCNGHPFNGYMSPEQAIAENHYDVPRPTKKLHRRSNSCSDGTTWRIQLNDSPSSTASTGVSSPEEVRRHPISAPSSPVLGYGILSSRDQSIYKSLGSSSSKLGKPSFAQLGLMRDAKKTGIMSKTGPSPSVLSVWNRRIFTLKGNFLFYFDPVDKPIAAAPVLGGVYIKDSLIERISLPFARRVLKITPPVARRTGWDKENGSGSFYIKFRTEQGRNEWYEALMSVSLGHDETRTS